MVVLYNIVDLTNLNWVTSHNGGVSYGCYYKASTIENGEKIYYKCSNFNSNSGFFGDESVYEVICSRFLSRLGFNCVRYTLVKAKIQLKGVVYTTFVCRSVDFSKGCTSRMSFESLREMYMNLTLDEFIDKFNFRNNIYAFFLSDFLIIGRDRHGANIEVLLNSNGDYKIAPIFDNGISLLAPYPSYDKAFSSSIVNFDSLADLPVNNYIGSRSLYSNLKLLRGKASLNKLTISDRKAIFYNMSDVLPKNYRDKIWEILTYRYMFLRKRNLIIER